MKGNAIGAMLAAVSFAAVATEPCAPGQVPFFDAHVHLNDEAQHLDLMRRWCARRAVVFWGRNSDNESIAAAARRHPDRFVAFASISPERQRYRNAWQADDTQVLDELDQLLASGRFSGIGEISAVHFPSPGFAETDFRPTGAVMAGILALAQKHRVPVMVHVEWTRMSELSDLLRRFADVPVIWAHGGYTPLFIARRMLDQHPNLVYELSARTWPRHPRSPEYTILRNGVDVWPEWLALIESMPTRFIVGTDASQRSAGERRSATPKALASPPGGPVRSAAAGNNDAMKAESVQSFLRQLTPATQQRVARGNLAELLKLPGAD